MLEDFAAWTPLLSVSDSRKNHSGVGRDPKRHDGKQATARSLHLELPQLGFKQVKYTKIQISNFTSVRIMGNSHLQLFLVVPSKQRRNSLKVSN